MAAHWFNKELSVSSSVQAPAQASAPTPARVVSRPRLALVMMIFVYPLVTVLLYAINPLTVGWTVWQRTLILVPLIVVAMVWGITPFIHSRFGRFVTVPAQR